MKKYLNLAISPFILIVFAFLAFRNAEALQNSVLNYHSPLAGVQIQPVEQLPPLTQRVVIVVVSGMSYQVSLQADMPIWDGLRKAGASTSVVAVPPTYWQSAWTTLMTGVWPDLNGAPILEIDQAGTLTPIAIDQICAAAKRAGLQVAVAGSTEWGQILPADAVDAGFFTPGTGVTADAEVVQATLGYIGDPQYQLILTQLGQMEETGRTDGLESEAFAGAARQIDSHVRQIMRQMNLAESVLVMTSDVALLEDRRSAGGEIHPPSLPLVMAGQNIIAGTYSPVRQVDLAPTVSLLLGTQPPVATAGYPLYEMLQLTPEGLTLHQLQTAVQKVALAEAYTQMIGQASLNEVIHQDLDTAQQSLVAGNRAGSSQLAQLVAREAMGEMEAAKLSRIRQERLPRMLAVAAFLLATLFVLRIRRPPHAWLSLLGAVLASATYYALYRLEGYRFSLADVGSSGTIFAPILTRNAAAGFAAGIILITFGLLAIEQRRWLADVAIVYDFGLFSVLLAAAPALFTYWRHGDVVSWYLPDLRLIVLQAMALRQVMLIALLSIPLPWLIGLFVWGIKRRRTRSPEGSRQWDPIAHLRR